MQVLGSIKAGKTVDLIFATALTPAA